MDQLNQQALAGLDSVLSAMIPVENDVNLQPVLHILPSRIRPAWLGGYIGEHQDPQADLHARRVEATASITVKSADENTLPSAVSSVTQAMLSADRAELIQQGLYRLKPTGQGPVSTTGNGPSQVSQLDITFEVIYEFVKVPTETEDIIDDIPLNVEVDIDEALVQPSTLFSIASDFSTDVMDWFQIVDDPDANQFTPSDWQYNQPASRIEHLSNIRGGGYQPTARKSGSYLLLSITPDRPAVRNFTVQTLFESTDVDGIGFVFRWQDVDNFYYFLASSRHNYSMFGKKVAGTFSFFAPHAIDETQGYTSNTQTLLRLIVNNSSFQIFMDDVLVLQGSDTDLANAGQVGFMCHGNSGARFYDFSLQEN